MFGTAKTAKARETDAEKEGEKKCTTLKSSN